MLNWRLNVSTNCATFSGIALTVGRRSNIQFNQTNLLYTVVAWAGIAPTGDFLQLHLTEGVQGAEATALGRLDELVARPDVLAGQQRASVVARRGFTEQRTEVRRALQSQLPS